MKQTIHSLLILTASAGVSSAAWTASNLSWEDDGVSNTPLTGWVETSLGSDPLDAGDFRVARDPDNWFPDSTAGTHVLLLEGDNGNEFGSLSQLLGGSAEAGTYTFSLADVGVTNFADNENAQLSFGFSLDGINFIGGSSQTLTEGSGGFGSPDNGATALNPSVSYTSDGTEGALYIMLATTGAHTGRSVPSIGSSSLDFTTVPEPSSTALFGLGGMALILRRRK
ncbi:PEP-CTERM sorting domain-containing protein [Verrucomicrobiaceae bacterium N1E253]|uniref:PEP-CTERM sorting domain-containing protein n=1 Tax=Oceaniferula marina TaxID=2748318 RepID=A0A851GI07_9BACT|nr:PEP-CTERM sorting domain-containing protein [Oceaniferula marina]NWK54767.1 PEP-CTERM sorting domain-containing protein [Oceaniferula marina]